MIIVVMMEPPSPTCPGSSSSLASSSWSRTGSSAEGSQSDVLPTFFLFQVFLSANQFSLPDKCKPPSLGDQRLGQLPHLLQLRHQVGEAPILFFRTISSIVRCVRFKTSLRNFVTGKKESQGSHQLRQVSWISDLYCCSRHCFFLLLYLSLCLCFTKETEGQNAHNRAKCSWQQWAWTCLFLFENWKKFLYCAFLFMNIYDVPLEIALKCDCKVLGLRLTSGNKATQGANFTISHWCFLRKKTFLRWNHIDNFCLFAKQ